MKYKKRIVSLIILIAVFFIMGSFAISHYAEYLGEQTTEITSDLLLRILRYQVISDIFYGFAVVLLCLLVSAFAYQKIKNHCKKG